MTRSLFLHFALPVLLSLSPLCSLFHSFSLFIQSSAHWIFIRWFEFFIVVVVVVVRWHWPENEKKNIAHEICWLMKRWRGRRRRDWFMSFFFICVFDCVAWCFCSYLFACWFFFSFPFPIRPFLLLLCHISYCFCFCLSISNGCCDWIVQSKWQQKIYYATTKHPDKLYGGHKSHNYILLTHLSTHACTRTHADRMSEREREIRACLRCKPYAISSNQRIQFSEKLFFSFSTIEFSFLFSKNVVRATFLFHSSSFFAATSKA